MAYLSFWHAFTYRKAMAKNTAVKNNMVTSCIAGLAIKWQTTPA